MIRKSDRDLDQVTMADETPEWPPAELDFDKPTIARAYDALLGGKDNFAADRALADQTAELIPGLPESAIENRRVLVRGVRYLAREAGMDQFPDGLAWAFPPVPMGSGAVPFVQVNPRFRGRARYGV